MEQHLKEVMLTIAGFVGVGSVIWLYGICILGVCQCACGPGKCECTCGCKKNCPCFFKDKSAQSDRNKRGYRGY